MTPTTLYVIKYYIKKINNEKERVGNNQSRLFFFVLFFSRSNKSYSPWVFTGFSCGALVWLKTSKHFFLFKSQSDSAVLSWLLWVVALERVIGLFLRPFPCVIPSKERLFLEDKLDTAAVGSTVYIREGTSRYTLVVEENSEVAYISKMSWKILY